MMHLSKGHTPLGRKRTVGDGAQRCIADATNPLASFFEQDTRAFLWQHGSMLNHSTLPEVQAAGWDSLRSASAINERGQIVGIGERDGIDHGFLLTPVPEPGTLALLLLVLAFMGVHARRSPPKTRMAV